MTVNNSIIGVPGFRLYYGYGYTLDFLREETDVLQ